MPFAAGQAVFAHRQITCEPGLATLRCLIVFTCTQMSSRKLSTLRACGADDGTATRTPLAWMILLNLFWHCGKSCSSCGSLLVSRNGSLLPSAEALSDFQAGHHPIDDVEGAT